MNSMIFKHGTPFHDLVIHRLNMAELLVTHVLKATTKGVQVWIQHQKFTNRSFYIKSLIKKKSHMKSLVWD